jgi:hypothetical protein
MTAIDRLGSQLEAAAARQVSRKRRRRVRPLALTAIVVSLGAAAAGWAATSLLKSGSPVPYHYGPPVAGRSEGAPIPGTMKLLISHVADPAGGAPWGLRYWETDRKYACIQVGRVYEGRLGQITGGKVFHELRPGVSVGALGGCFIQDGAGHAFAAVHTGAQSGAQPQTCPGADCRVPLTVDFGLLGPNAKRFTYRAGGRTHTATPRGGAYLVVQKHLAPVVRETGFHHKNAQLNLHVSAEPYLTLTPASQVITRVDYAGGACRVRITQQIYGSCYAQTGYVPIPQPAAGDVRAPVRATAARDGIRVRFRARQAVIDGRTGYTIEIRPDHGHGFVTQMYERNVAAGTEIDHTYGLYNHIRGGYRIVVRYRSVNARPGPTGSLAYPGLLVGEARVRVP